MICTSEINTITILSVLGVIIYIVLSGKTKQQNEYEKKLQLLDQMIGESKKTIASKIDKRQDKLKENLTQSREYASVDTIYIPPTPTPTSTCTTAAPTQPTTFVPSQPNPLYLPSMVPLPPTLVPPVDPVNMRDRAVVMDQLYPPLGRVERPIFDQLASRVASGLVGYPTRGSPDTYRMVGYMVNSENKNDTWKLFGRQKFPGSSIGEYYAIPIDDRKSDMKVTIKDDMMPKDKIRDIYSLPNEVVLNSPLFSDKAYKVVELDKADLTSPYL